MAGRQVASPRLSQVHIRVTEPTPEEIWAIRPAIKAGVARADEDEDERMPDEIRRLLDEN